MEIPETKQEQVYAIKSAAYNGDSERLFFLLSSTGIPENLGNNYIIRITSKNGYLDLVKKLLTMPKVNPAAMGNYALRFAAKGGKEKVVETLLADPRIDASECFHAIMTKAVERGWTSVARTIFARHRHCSKFNCEVYVNFAVRFNRIETIELFQRGDVEYCNLFFYNATKNDSLAMVLALLRIDPDGGRNKVFVYATNQENVELIKELLERLDPSRFPDNIRVALGTAARYGRNEKSLEIFKMLFTDPRIKVWPKELLLAATKGGSYTVVKMLLEDYRFKWSNKNTITAFFLADNQVFELLLSDLRIDPTVEDNFLVRYFASKKANQREYNAFQMLLRDRRVRYRLLENPSETFIASIWKEIRYRLFIVGNLPIPNDSQTIIKEHLFTTNVGTRPWREDLLEYRDEFANHNGRRP